MLRHLLPGAWRKDVISQVDRLSSKETKIAGRSVWIAVGASVRSAATCMVVSRVGGLATSLCRARRSLSRRPWDFSRHTPCRSPGALTRVAARTLAQSPIRDQLHRRLQPFRHLHDCSGCFRLERLAGWGCTHWKAPPCHGAHVKRTFRIAARASPWNKEFSRRRKRRPRGCFERREGPNRTPTENVRASCGIGLRAHRDSVSAQRVMPRL